MKKVVMTILTALVILFTTGASISPAHAEELSTQTMGSEPVEVGVTLNHNWFSCDAHSKIDIGTPPASPYPFGSFSSSQPTGEGVLYKDGSWWWVSSSDRIDETAIFQLFNWRIENH